MARWALRLLLVEKALQHVIVTWALAFDLGDIRNDLAVDYRPLVVIGGLGAALYAAALAGHLLQHRWPLWLAVGLAILDIGGELIAQGTLFITVNVSFIVAIAVLVLSAYGLRSTTNR